MRVSLRLARTRLRGWKEVTCTGQRLGSTCPDRCFTVRVPFKGIFPRIVMQSQGTEDKLAQTHPSVSLSEMQRTRWLWVSVAEPVEEEVDICFRQIRPSPALICLHLCSFFFFVLFLEWQLNIEHSVGKDQVKFLSEKLHQTVAKKKKRERKRWWFCSLFPQHSEQPLLLSQGELLMSL